MFGNDKCSLKVFLSTRERVLSVAPSKKGVQKAILGDQVRIQMNTFSNFQDCYAGYWSSWLGFQSSFRFVDIYLMNA